MATPIISGFSLGSATPIDERIVASGSSERDAITYKYDGLRVYDTHDHIPYVWVGDSATWSSENINSILGTGSTNYIPIFTPDGQHLGNSGIYKSGNSYNINDLVVGTATGKFVGNGSSLTNLNINSASGVLAVSNLPGCTSSYLIVGAGTGISPVYKNPDLVTVGHSTTTESLVNTSTIIGSLSKSGHIAASAPLVNIGTMSVPPSSTVFVETTFASRINTTTSPYYYYQSNTLYYMYMVDMSGNLTLSGATVSVFSSNNNDLIVTIYGGVLLASTNLITFKQQLLSTANFDYNICVNYKATICTL